MVGFYRVFWAFVLLPLCLSVSNPKIYTYTVIMI